MTSQCKIAYKEVPNLGINYDIILFAQLYRVQIAGLDFLASFCKCRYNSLTILQVHIDGDSLHMGRQLLELTLTVQSYAKTQPKFDVFDEWFLELEAVLDRWNSTKQVLSTSTYLLMLYLKFFWIRKNWPRSSFFHELPLLRDIENQFIAFLTPKMKTSTMVCLRSNLFWWSKATCEITFVGPLYVKFRHFGNTSLFIFLRITQYL